VIVASIVTFDSSSTNTTKPLVCDELLDSSSITTIFGIEQLDISTKIKM
jgi:hypothetical protein